MRRGECEVDTTEYDFIEWEAMLIWICEDALLVLACKDDELPTNSIREGYQ